MGLFQVVVRVYIASLKKPFNVFVVLCFRCLSTTDNLRKVQLRTETDMSSMKFALAGFSAVLLLFPAVVTSASIAVAAKGNSLDWNHLISSMNFFLLHFLSTIKTYTVHAY